MKNPERQDSLDRAIYLESERRGYDTAGEQVYCSCCEFHDSVCKTCTVDYAEQLMISGRPRNTFCATAYNRYYRTH